MACAELLTIDYCFEWPDGRRLDVSVELDPETLQAKAAQLSDPPPDWVRLGMRQCPNCPLSEAHERWCPVARQVSPWLDIFADANSYDRVAVTVTTAERSYSAQTSVQQGVSALMGVVMATSGCPVLDPMRPMARFHLPFASYEETAYRAVSMYLVAQHLRAQRGEAADWALEGFLDIYRAIQVVNQAFASRLQQCISNDANANALVILDCFAMMTAMDVELGRSIPKSLQPMFDPLMARAAIAKSAD